MLYNHLHFIFRAVTFITQDQRDFLIPWGFHVDGTEKHTMKLSWSTSKNFTFAHPDPDLHRS
jgi:hypothetical protein